MPHGTIYDMLAEAATGESLAKSHSGRIFPLPDPFKDYLLRIRGISFQGGGTFKARLSNTSSLTPVDYGLRHNFGQPVLEIGDIEEEVQIVLKNGQKSLAMLYKERVDAHPDDPYLGVLEARQEIANLPLQSFVIFLRDIKYLNEHGYSVDFSKGNIMLKGDRLSLVDVLAFPSHIPDSLEQLEEGTEFGREFHRKLEEANKKVGIPETKVEAAQYAENHPVILNGVKEITEIARIPITAAPSLLRLKLNEIEEHLGLPYK